ncbi:GntR family transcriptional regulator [Paracoccus sp. WLY502]|uniref:GntR family transcriptional regulator n=1 Tax=Paracoccus yibinensis TaxID=3068891 RepID=UPI00358E324E
MRRSSSGCGTGSTKRACLPERRCRSGSFAKNSDLADPDEGGAQGACGRRPDRASSQSGRADQGADAGRGWGSDGPHGRPGGSCRPSGLRADHGRGIPAYRLHQDMYANFLRGDRPRYFQCNQAIHEALFSAAGNAALDAMARSLQMRLRRARYTASSDAQGERWREAMREHELILDALRRRDGAAIATVLFAHLRSTRDAILRQIPE